VLCVWEGRAAEGVGTAGVVHVEESPVGLHALGGCACA